MTQPSEETPLNPDDELGQIEAEYPPDGQVESDPYVVDPSYDATLATLDPEEQGGDLPTSEEEWTG